MYLSDIYKLEKLIDRESDSDKLRYVHIGDNRATVGTGSAIAVVPAAVGVGDVHGPVTIDSIEYARKHGLSPNAVLHLVTDSAAVAEDSTEFPRSYGSFAKQREGEQLELFRQGTAGVEGMEQITEQLIPRVTDGEGDRVIKLNAKLLWDLAQALGADKDKPVTLRIPKPPEEGGVRIVRVEGVDGAYGALGMCR
jgi:hypothetical protein